MLRGYVKALPGYWSFLLFDLKGRIVAGVNADMGDLTGGDRADRDYARQIFSGKDVALSESVMKAASGNVLIEGNTAPPTQTAPTITTQPTISGGTAIGDILTLAPGAATGNPAPTATYQWYRNGTALPGEDALTLDTGGYGAGVYHATVIWANSAVVLS